MYKLRTGRQGNLSEIREELWERIQREYSKGIYVGVRKGGGLRGHLNDFKK